MTMQPIGAGGIPDLGARPQRLRVGVSATAFPRHIDKDGVAWEGAPGDPALRASYMDGEQLLAAIQGCVRHELRRALTKAGTRPPDEGASQVDYLTECAVPSCDRPQAQSMLIGLGDPDGIGVEVPICQGHLDAFDKLREAVGGETPPEEAGT